MNDSDAGGLTGPRPERLADEADLESLIESEDLVLLELYTEGCSLCKSMETVIGAVARETGVTPAMLNPRDDPPLIDRFDVRSVPTLVLFEDGERVATLADGYVETERLVAFVENRGDDAAS